MKSSSKSSSGKYYIGLDHIRAIAVYMVFTWHFIHVRDGQYASPPIFPLSLLTEGHTGVALFITLSGYLFAKLLDGKKIKYLPFIWNRCLRLGPLLCLVILLVGLDTLLTGGSLSGYTSSILQGVVKPTLPNGGWSITVEFHFYLALMFLLALARKSKYSLMLVVAAAIGLRHVLHAEVGQVQMLSYFTIVGRIDQFLLGILAYQFRDVLKKNHLVCGGLVFLFTVFYWFFDSQGGFYGGAAYPSQSPVWIYMPTIEGVVYASVISWYDNSFTHATGKFSRLIASIGSYSYSIYLLHFFVVFEAGKMIDAHITDLSSPYIAIFFSSLCFLLMVPIGYMSNKYIESPFLKLRRPYIVNKVEGK